MPGGKHEVMDLWTAEEDSLLRELIAVHGQAWNKIQRKFKERSRASIRNRWRRINLSYEKINRCSKCGKWKRGHTCVLKSDQKRSDAFDTHPIDFPVNTLTFLQELGIGVDFEFFV